MSLRIVPILSFPITPITPTTPTTPIIPIGPNLPTFPLTLFSSWDSNSEGVAGDTY